MSLVEVEKMLKLNGSMMMGILAVAIAAATLPVNTVAASTSGVVTATVTVQQRVALTISPTAATDPTSSVTQANVESTMTSEWIHGEDGAKLLITVVPAP